jgi:hypothetical protein
MNFKSRLVSAPPRVLLIFPAIFVALMSMLAGALSSNYTRPALAALALALGIFWLGLLVLIALPQTDRWLSRIQRWFKPLATAVMVLLVVAGVVELVALLATNLGTTGGVLGENTPKFLSFISHDLSSGDAVALLEQAVTNVREGKNPYANANIVSAVIADNSPFDKTTPLRLGRFASDFPYPSTAEIDSLWEQAVKNPDTIPVEIESKLGYPSGFFLIPAFFSVLGVHNIHGVYLLLAIAAMAVAFCVTPSRLRLWLVGVFLGSLVIWNGIAGGNTGSLYFPFLLLAWALWRKNLWASAVCMGIAVATKQVAWFFLPFYAIVIIRHLLWKKSLLSAGLVISVFAAFNLPYILAGAPVWFDSVVSMMKDALFPSGWGAITLVLQGWIHIESPLAFTLMETAMMVAAIFWYWRNARKYPHIGVILPLFVLFFAWRSLWPYFFYADAILLVVVLQDYATAKISTIGVQTPAVE